MSSSRSRCVTFVGSIDSDTVATDASLAVALASMHARGNGSILLLCSHTCRRRPQGQGWSSPL